MSRMMDSIRRLFAKDDAEEAEAKRRREHGPMQYEPVAASASAAAPASSSSSSWFGPPPGAADPIPADFERRLGRVVALGWPAALAAQALELNHYHGGPAITWLKQHHPLQHPSAAAAASSSARPALSSRLPDQPATPTRFERLPPIPPLHNNNAHTNGNPSQPQSQSAAPSSAASSLSVPSAQDSALHSDSSSQRSTPPSSPALSVSPAHAAAPPPPPPPSLPLTWNCALCTFENALTNARCEMCNTPHALTDAERATRSNLMECMICFESVPRDQCFEPQEADACRHYLCRECAAAYLRSKIDSGSLSSLRCCADKCARPLSAVEMQSGLSERDYKRYQRFLRLQQLAADPTVVFCSSSGCDVALFGGPGVAQLQCPGCKRSVCFVCRVPWHEHQSCAEYRHSQSQLSEVAKAAQVAAGERLFSEYLHRNGGQFRQCKRCYSWIEKSEGCDKMTCRCGAQFCHKCGSENARCNCTPYGHVFFDHATVLRNWQSRY